MCCSAIAVDDVRAKEPLRLERKELRWGVDASAPSSCSAIAVEVAHAVEPLRLERKVLRWGVDASAPSPSAVASAARGKLAESICGLVGEGVT